MSSEFPEPFFAVLARLREAMALLQAGAAHRSAAPAHTSAAEPLGALLQLCARDLGSSGQTAVAMVVQGCAAALQRMRTVPSLQGEDGLAAVERALEAALAQAEQPVREALAVASDLFPVYRAVQHLAGADRVHPADLWPARPVDVVWPEDAFTRPRPMDAAARDAMEAALLALMRQPQAQDFQRMSELCAELGEGAVGPLSGLWKLASVVYEAQADQFLSPDVYLKRVGPRLLALTRPAATASSGETAPHLAGALPEPVRLLRHELQFFCHRAAAAAVGAAPGPLLRRFVTAVALPAGPSAEPTVDVEDLTDSSHDPRAGAGTTVPTAPATPAARTLAEAVPGLPDAADLDLSGWALAANADQAALPGDELKVIGPLRLEIRAFNAFLNDADEASRRLVTLIAEWGVEPTQALPAEAVAQAHLLAQRAQEVGYEALAVLAQLLARLLEQELQWPSSPSSTPPIAAVAELLSDSAEEVRRVLHQFAAGFLTEPSAEGLDALRSCLAPSRQVLLALDSLAHLQAQVTTALERLSSCRPSAVAAQAGLGVGDPQAAEVLARSDQCFDGAWTDATAGLTACQPQIEALRLALEGRDPQRTH